MRQVMSPTLSYDPVNLEEEFPQWLEKVASKVHGGITIVIDSADKLQVIHNKQITEVKVIFAVVK